MLETPQVPSFDPTCPGRDDEIDTALGCIPTNPNEFVRIALPWAIGIGAGTGFGLMLYGVLMTILSAGNPEKMQAGRELVTSAIAGIVIIVFAVFIFSVIGIDILGLF